MKWMKEWQGDFIIGLLSVIVSELTKNAVLSFGWAVFGCLWFIAGAVGSFNRKD
jgi:hypothetical protein